MRKCLIKYDGEVSTIMKRQNCPHFFDGKCLIELALEKGKAKMGACTLEKMNLQRPRDMLDILDEEIRKHGPDGRWK